MRPEWVESIHRQCRRSDVPFFFKQWGGVRKDTTGRELHGRTYDEMPQVQTVAEGRELLPQLCWLGASNL
jgi:protein gp37